jgi:hypothetical protein
MNRHQRRKAAARSKIGSRRSKKVQAGLSTTTIPDDLKGDIAQSVRSIPIETHGLDVGGTCWLRAAVGFEFLRTCIGISVGLAYGGVVFRAGPDWQRDVVSYCGEGNVGQIIPGLGFSGHYWVQSANEIIDFSCGDWQRELDLSIAARPDGLGPIEWVATPPDFIWVDKGTVAPIRGQNTPEVGKAFYGGWRGPNLPIEDNLRELKTVLDWQAITRHFEASCEHHALKERVWAAQNGHTAVRLSRLRNLVGLPPPRDEQCLVLHGEVEITPKTAAKILSELSHTFH